MQYISNKTTYYGGFATREGTFYLSKATFDSYSHTLKASYHSFLYYPDSPEVGGVTITFDPIYLLPGSVFIISHWYEGGGYHYGSRDPTLCATPAFPSNRNPFQP